MKSTFFHHAFLLVPVWHVAVFFSCLSLFVIMGNPLQAVHPQEEHKAGDRMTLTIKSVEYAFRWCPQGYVHDG